MTLSSLRRTALMSSFAFVVIAGCGPRVIELPAARPLITKTGERLRATPERLSEIDTWVRAELDSINVDPSFWIISRFETEEVQPWDGLAISNDTAIVRLQAAPPEVVSSYQIYAHLHLMVAFDRRDVWLAEAPGVEGFELEKAILKRTSDAWFYARSIFDAIPFGPLDELMYSNENGYLDAYVLTARPEEFKDEHEAWMAANPGQAAEFEQWFTETFERPPPGKRENAQS